MGPDVDFTMRIADFQILAGRANKKAVAQVTTWASDNIGLLERKWSEYNERG